MNDNKKEEPSEEVPLKDLNDTGGGQAAGGEKAGLFGRPRVLWCVALSALPLLGGVVLGATLLAGDDSNWAFYTYDSNITLLEMFPKPNRPRNLLTFRHGSLPHEGREWPQLTQQLQKVLRGYQNVSRVRNLTECFDNRPFEHAVCYFDTRLLTLECSEAMNFGYESGRPCVIFQFTNKTDWEPEAYTTRDIESLPYFPDSLRYIYKSKLAFFECLGDTIVDQENMGPVLYSPERGLNSKYFPYKGQPEYMSPLVAVHFEKPAVGIAISITCKLWARNINQTEQGTISFTLLVE